MTELSGGGLLLRPLRGSDRREWDRLRISNRAWLDPWEATTPPSAGGAVAPAPTFRQYVRQQRRSARRGEGYGWAVVTDGQMVGQVTLTGILRGSMQSGSVGYWISEDHAGRGIIPRAVAMVCDFAFLTAGLHRVEICIRPENTASLRVVEKLRFRDEGVRQRFLHIQGGWRDHRVFALTAEEIGTGLVARLSSGLGDTPTSRPGQG